MSSVEERHQLRAEQVGRLRGAIQIAHYFLASGQEAAAHDVIERMFAEIETDVASEKAEMERDRLSR